MKVVRPAPANPLARNHAIFSNLINSMAGWPRVDAAGVRLPAVTGRRQVLREVCPRSWPKIAHI